MPRLVCGPECERALSVHSRKGASRRSGSGHNMGFQIEGGTTALACRAATCKCHNSHDEVLHKLCAPPARFVPSFSLPRSLLPGRCCFTWLRTGTGGTTRLADCSGDMIGFLVPLIMGIP